MANRMLNDDWPRQRTYAATDILTLGTMHASECPQKPEKTRFYTGVKVDCVRDNEYNRDMQMKHWKPKWVWSLKVYWECISQTRKRSKTNDLHKPLGVSLGYNKKWLTWCYFSFLNLPICGWLQTCEIDPICNRCMSASRRHQQPGWMVW